MGLNSTRLVSLTKKKMLFEVGDTQEECRMVTEAETGIICQGISGATRSWKRKEQILPRGLEGASVQFSSFQSLSHI